MKSGARLPSITVILALIGTALLLPLGAIAAAQWQDAEERYDAALHVGSAADQLSLLIQLAPALNDEIRSTTWQTNGDGLLAALPPDVAALVGVDFGDSLVTDRIRVDGLLTALGDADTASELAQIRSQADAGQFGLFDGAERFEAVIDDIEGRITTELRIVNDSAFAAQDDDIARAARIAEAAADLQVVAAGQKDKWAQLAASPYLSPSQADVADFAASVTLFKERSSALERVVVRGTPLDRSWSSAMSSPAATQVLAAYDDTVLRFTAEGLPSGPEGSSTLDLTNVSIAELFGLVTNLNETVDQAEIFDDSISDVVDAALADLDTASRDAVAGALGDRNQTVIWLAGAAFMVTAAVLALIVLVGRPVRRMAEAAEQLSFGHLDTHLSERGPKEVRNSAKALNQALESLRNTESQAIALAEERLDDPILEKHAVGGIGESLQTAVARLATSLTERENFQQKLAHEAAHDGLTKISNRNAILRHLNAALARTQRSSSPLALLFLDIDDFKTINDAHGHHAGDAVLRTVAQRLVNVIREGDLAGRLGGDEFVVIAEAVSNIDEVLELSERVVEAVCQPVTFDGGTFVPSISIGVAMADGTLSADELLRDADLAVYRAKSQGKGRIDVCDEDLRGEVRERASVEKALETALDNNEFILHFQPSVNATTHQITSFEALVRWNHPERGLVYPDEFIPIAERSNLIARIDRWVLDSASAQLSAWTTNPDFASLPVAVNVSGRHLGSGSLFGDVLGALEKHNVEPSRLLLEVTETALLADLVTAARELAQLRDAGVRVALDDFGTGYMSLAHLRTLPVDVLKIDQTFIAEMGGDSHHPLIRLIIDTGHLLGVDVTAEGVETSSQADTLTSMGVDSLQGFYFGRPVESASIEPEAAPATSKAA